MKRILVWLVAAMALTAVGCQKEKKADEPVKLRFSWWGGEGRHQATLAAIDLYQKKHPNIKIEAEYGGWDGYYQKLVTQLAGGTAADIIQIDQPWLFELSSKGDVFLSLDGNKDFDASGFDQNFLSNYCKYNNVLKGLPTGLNGETFLIDTALLKKSGVDPKTVWTWENIVTEGAKVNKANPSTYFFAITPDQFRMLLVRYLSQSAGSVVTADKKLGFTEKQAEEAFTYLKQWIDQKITAPFKQSVLFTRKTEENPDWINGNLAVNLSWASNMDKMIGSKADMGVAQLPVLSKAVQSGVLVRPSQIIVVNKASKAGDEAVKFLNFFFNDPEALVALGSSRGVSPTVKGRALLKEKNLMKPLVEEATNKALAQMGKPQSVWEMNSEIERILDDTVEEFGFGKLTPAAAAKKLTENLTAKLAAL